VSVCVCRWSASCRERAENKIERERGEGGRDRVNEVMLECVLQRALLLHVKVSVMGCVCVCVRVCVCVEGAHHAEYLLRQRQRENEVCVCERERVR